MRSSGRPGAQRGRNASRPRSPSGGSSCRHLAGSGLSSGGPGQRLVPGAVRPLRRRRHLQSSRLARLSFIHPIAIIPTSVFSVGFSAGAIAGERQAGTLRSRSPDRSRGGRSTDAVPAAFGLSRHRGIAAGGRDCRVLFAGVIGDSPSAICRSVAERAAVRLVHGHRARGVGVVRSPAAALG